ncbi:hypothetical protein FRB95_012603 [Tulasnella sp. JGI-2019a]|nr:hypothetical protein FRB95_012603 [Tulasnella sp. JGI-2019a]
MLTFTRYSTGDEDNEQQIYNYFEDYTLPPEAATIVGAWVECLKASPVVPHDLKTTLLASLHAQILSLPHQANEPAALTASRFFSWLEILASLSGTLAGFWMLEAIYHSLDSLNRHLKPLG